MNCFELQNPPYSIYESMISSIKFIKNCSIFLPYDTVNKLWEYESEWYEGGGGVGEVITGVQWHWGFVKTSFVWW